ncbi:cohesin domain-containing protein [Parasediminibacterium sp. JCM 36343]|uniref:cohesin domain-containing protein n=1 Tax=Parasediminibacterium sp. JCM 36343 TaxID=3374279 RepID=UPI00397B1942
MNKKYTFSLFLLLAAFSFTKVFATYKESDTTIMPPFATTTYNDTFYNTVLQAAKGIAQPFLLQQGYFSLPGVTVVDTSLVYKGVKYPTSEKYLNPATGYYLASSLYGTYGISNFSTVWPNRCPNAFYTTTTKTFTANIDCVGYGTRLLSAVGGTASANNPYLNLINRITANNYAPIANKGYVATAYQFAVAFPTLRSTPVPGWQYISGNVEDSTINAYDQTIDKTLKTYNGLRKGGFSLCKSGDVLAFGYGPVASSNGHFMILENKPIALDATTLKPYYPKETAKKLKAFVAKHKVYAVNVFDDSGQDAHFNDSRKNNSGIGHGTVLIVTDTLDDAPVGFMFSGSTNISYTPLDTSHTYAISVGRFTSKAQLPTTIAGSVTSALGTVIPSVTFNLTGDTSSSLISSTKGLYNFLVAGAGDYTIKPFKINDVKKNNGVTVADALLVQGYELGIVDLNSPYKLIAADADNNGSITALDVALIKRFALGLDTVFKGNRLWTFVDSSYVFSEPSNPFPYKDSISYTNLTGNKASQSFIGVKIGDVNYDWDASALKATNGINRPVEIFYNNISITGNETEIRLPLRVNYFKNMLGLQFTLNYNNKLLQLTGIKKNRLNLEYGTNHAGEGKLTFLWMSAGLEAKNLEDSTILMELVFSKKGDIVKEDVAISSDIATAEAWDANFTKHSIVKGSGKIAAEAAIRASAENCELVNNVTNGMLTMHVSVNETKPIQFELFTMDGKIMIRKKLVAIAGTSNVVLNLGEETKLAAGFYYLKASGINSTSVKRIMIVPDR